MSLVIVKFSTILNSDCFAMLLYLDEGKLLFAILLLRLLLEFIILLFALLEFLDVFFLMVPGAPLSRAPAVAVINIPFFGFSGSGKGVRVNEWPITECSSGNCVDE